MARCLSSKSPMSVFSRCNRLSVTAAEFNSVGARGSIHHIRSPAQVNFYYGAANAHQRNDPPLPSAQRSRGARGRTSARGAFMGSTNLSANSSRMQDRGGDSGLFNMHDPSGNERCTYRDHPCVLRCSLISVLFYLAYAAGAYDEGNGNLHDDSQPERSTDYEIYRHGEPPSLVLNINSISLPRSTFAHPPQL